MSRCPTFEAHSSYISPCSRRQSRTSPIWGESRANRKLTHYPKGHLPLTTRGKARPDIRSEKYVFSRSPTRQGCCVTSISPGLIDVGLHFRADVLGVGQIKFSGFQALVAKPSLDVHQVHTVPQPAGRTGLSQAVEMVFLADRACGTCNLRGLPQMIFPLLDRRFAVSAVQPGTLGDGLELAEEVALRVSILIHKNPAAMGRILFPLLEQFNQFGGQRNPAFLVIFGTKLTSSLPSPVTWYLRCFPSMSSQVAYCTSCSRQAVCKKNR